MYCNFSIIKGLRKGQICNKPISKKSGDDKCKTHTFVQRCNILIIKGIRRNKNCNKKLCVESSTLCKTHYLLEIGKPLNPYNENESNVILKGNSFSSENGSITIEKDVLMEKVSGGVLDKLKTL